MSDFENISKTSWTGPLGNGAERRQASEAARKLANEVHVIQLRSDYGSLERAAQLIEAALQKERERVLEEAMAIYVQAFEQNWIVQDTIDAIRALAKSASTRIGE